MRFQDAVIEMTQDATTGLMRTALAVPDDRWEWKPMDVGRTVLDQIAECYQVAQWFGRIYESRSVEFFTRDFVVSERRKRGALTREDIQSQWDAVHEQMYVSMRSLTDADLEITLQLRPGWDSTLRQMCYFPLRNLWYHMGQINYIQTLYGDQEMH